MKTEFNFIGRCPVKGCDCILRVTVPALIRDHTRNINYVPGAGNPPIWQSYQTSEAAWRPYSLYLHCAKHRRQIGWHEIAGFLNADHKCDARCTGARGHNCECSCGGKNHGADWAIAA